MKNAVKDTFFCKRSSLVCDGRLITVDEPMVMGILNATPDSFFQGSRFRKESEVLKRAGEILNEGGQFIDVGGYSSRPGAKNISEEEEKERVLPVVRAIKKEFPEAQISVDTFRGSVAQDALEEGASLINDISAGTFDPSIMEVAGKWKVPYIMMHMQGTPQSMQKDPTYGNIMAEVLHFFSERKARLIEHGVNDIIVDPGFGFGKTREHNYRMMNELELFKLLGLPVMVGVSRKSMIKHVLGTPSEEALNGTTTLHAAALLKGTSILRVHDVREAVEAVKIITFVQNPEKPLP